MGESSHNQSQQSSYLVSTITRQGKPHRPQQPAIGPQTPKNFRLEIVLRELALSAGALSGPFPPGLAQGRLDVVALQTGHAKVAVRVTPRFPDLDPVITLSKGANGWRIDDCSCVPHGY